MFKCHTGDKLLKRHKLAIYVSVENNLFNLDNISDEGKKNIEFICIVFVTCSLDHYYEKYGKVIVIIRRKS